MNYLIIAIERENDDSNPTILQCFYPSWQSGLESISFPRARHSFKTVVMRIEVMKIGNKITVSLKPIPTIPLTPVGGNS